MPRPLNGSPRHRRRTTTSIACHRSVPNDRPGTTTTPSTARWRTAPPARAHITNHRSPTRSPARSNMTRITTREGRSQDPPEPRHVLRHHVCRLLELEPRERRWRDDVRGHVALLLARWLLLLVESFPGSSIFPFTLGMGAFFTVLALVFGIWFLVPGLGLAAWAIFGATAEGRRGGHV